MRYDGGKNGAGVYQTIINAIPRHEVYLEPFAGSAAIYRHKAPAARSILIERNPAMVDQLRQIVSGSALVICGDALHYLGEHPQQYQNSAGHFFYIDPPYLHTTRQDLKVYGDFELTNDQHLYLVHQLLPGLTKVGALFALSGYRSAMYDDAAGAHRWHRLDYTAQTRRGPVTESLWTNYDPAGRPPAELTYLGDTYRERERLRRKAARWRARLLAMPDLERRYVLAELASIAISDDGGRHRQT